MTNSCPALGPRLGKYDRINLMHMKGHEHFIPTKFHQNPASGSGEEVENVKFYGWTTTGGRTDDCLRAMIIAYLRLRLR